MKYIKKPLSYKTALALTIATAGIIFFGGTYIQSHTTTRYRGMLPCADCTGIKTTLTIKGDHTYQLQSFYINRGTPFTESGTWEMVDKNNKTYYQLKSGHLITYYRIINDRIVQMVDNNQNPIRTPVNTDLIRE